MEYVHTLPLIRSCRLAVFVMACAAISWGGGSSESLYINTPIVVDFRLLVHYFWEPDRVRFFTFPASGEEASKQ